MFNETDGGGGGGGFFNADTSFGGGSPQKSRKGGEKRAQNIMPVTAKQVLSCPEDGMKIGNLDVYLVTLVGIVRSIETTSVKITYTLEDNTGCIEGVHWIDGQEDNGQSAQPLVVENTHCRLSGTIRSQGEKRYIMAFNIQQIEDFNEITTHFLEVALFCKKAEVLAQNGEAMDTGSAAGPSNGVGMNSNHLSNSLMTSSEPMTISGLTSVQRAALRAIQKCTSESGIHLEDLLAQLQDSGSRQSIKDAIEFLCSEGHIYTTVDDFHYKTTDGM